jgi:aminomethyltransferase
LDISPVQARCGWAVAWSKPAFWGREALLAERTVGPRRVVWGLEPADRAIPRRGMVVMDAAGHPVGEVTSGTFSPSLGHGIGLALMSSSVSVGDRVTVDVRGRSCSMRVVRPPFVSVQEIAAGD